MGDIAEPPRLCTDSAWRSSLIMPPEISIPLRIAIPEWAIWGSRLLTLFWVLVAVGFAALVLGRTLLPTRRQVSEMSWPAREAFWGIKWASAFGLGSFAALLVWLHHFLLDDARFSILAMMDRKDDLPALIGMSVLAGLLGVALFLLAGRHATRSPLDRERSDRLRIASIHLLIWAILASPVVAWSVVYLWWPTSLVALVVPPAMLALSSRLQSVSQRNAFVAAPDTRIHRLAERAMESAEAPFHGVEVVPSRMADLYVLETGVVVVTTSALNDLDDLELGALLRAAAVRLRAPKVVSRCQMLSLDMVACVLLLRWSIPLAMPELEDWAFASLSVVGGILFHEMVQRIFWRRLNRRWALNEKEGDARRSALAKIIESNRGRIAGAILLDLENYRDERRSRRASKPRTRTWTAGAAMLGVIVTVLLGAIGTSAVVKSIAMDDATPPQDGLVTLVLMGGTGRELSKVGVQIVREGDALTGFAVAVAASSSTPDDPIVVARLATALAATGQCDAATVELERADFLAGRSRSSRPDGDLGTALEEARRAIRLCGD